jgi:hypothetical protein
MTIKDTARGYLRDALTAFNRAPTEVALAVLCAVLLSVALEGNHPFETWVQFAIAIFIAFACAWTATLLHGMHAISTRTRWLVTLAGALAAALYALLVQDMQREAEGWRALMLVVGVVLLAAAAPAWIAHDQAASLRLRRINGRFLLRAIGIGLYGLALFGGLALALAAIDNLFELELKGEIYGHVFGWIMLVLVPWVIVGGIASYLEPLDQVSDVARVVQRLTAFLVPPLLALYYLILVVYALRILITGELPKNLVSPMVLAAGLLTALALTLFDPAPQDARVGQRALRWAPLLFLLLSPLGMWALAARIDQYGWTEFRLLRVLLLVLLAALALLATVQLLRRRAFSLRVIPVVLGVALVLGAIGPWSVPAAARRDQQARLRAALRAARVDTTRAVTDTTRQVVPRQLYERINSTGYYLQSHFGEAALAGIVDVPAAQSMRGWSLAEALGLTPAVTDSGPAMPLYGSLSPHARVATAAGTLYRVSAPSPNVTVQGRTLVLNYGAQRLHVGVDPVIAVMQPMRVRTARGLPAVAWPALDDSRATRGELIIFEAVFEQSRDTLRVQRLEGVLLVR